jgi:hypothetical protein
MTRGSVELPGGLRLTVSLGPVHEAATTHHHYWVRIESLAGTRISSGGAPTYREAWDAVLQAVESAVREAA